MAIKTPVPNDIAVRIKSVSGRKTTYLSLKRLVLLMPMVSRGSINIMKS